MVGGGSDAWAIQLTRRRVPTALPSIPLRNMHSPVETVSIQDIKRVGRLLAAFVGTIDGAFLDSLAWKLGLEEEE